MDWYGHLQARVLHLLSIGGIQFAHWQPGEYMYTIHKRPSWTNIMNISCANININLCAKSASITSHNIC